MPSIRQPDPRDLAGVILFAVSVFASAFLIFFVQPMVGKHILPWFGGAAGVWTLCLAFYQCALFLGYAYAHLLTARVAVRHQPIVHGALFAAALAVLPVLPGETWKPVGTADPSGLILAMLTANVALPFLLLAATGPLLQAWFSRVLPGRSPYPLYAVSNLGSLLALLGYPFIVEPHLPLSSESRLWSWGFAASGLLTLCCSWLAARRSADGGATVAETTMRPADSRMDPGRILLWILLPAAAVVLFMGVTNELCLDVASVPFLWIVPLSIYLLTFVICFAGDRFYRRTPFVCMAAIFLLLIALRGSLDVPATWLRAVSSIQAQIALYSLALFSGCMLMHGELHRLRPAPRALTAYYLCIAGGGALGGLFVGIAAPRLFDGYYELPLGLGAAWLLFLAACRHGGARFVPARRLRWFWAITLSISLVGLALLAVRTLSVPAKVIAQQRNFFGILRILEDYPDRPYRHRLTLKNGTTTHGVQFRSAAARSKPSSYFGPVTGIGLVMRHRSAGTSTRVGVIGLGIGTLAAYGRPGDHFQFYEIDPDVVRIARDVRHFSYLADSRAEIEIVEGDARLSLESQLRDGGGENFDVLVLDAFSGDAIPVHLLTQEAFQLYLRHLREGGVLAVHVSNLHLRLAPLIFRLASNAGMHAMEIMNLEVPARLSYRSRWVILCRDSAYLDSLESFAGDLAPRLGRGPRTLTITHPDEANLTRSPLWTDDYSDLFGLLKPIRRPGRSGRR